MKKRIHLAIAGFFLCLTVMAKAVEKDTNVIISYAKDEYSFTYNKKQNRVEVKQVQTLRYLTNNTRAVLPIGETYSDNVSIDAGYRFKDIVGLNYGSSGSDFTANTSLASHNFQVGLTLKF